MDCSSAPPKDIYFPLTTCKTYAQNRDSHTFMGVYDNTDDPDLMIDGAVYNHANLLVFLSSTSDFTGAELVNA